MARLLTRTAVVLLALVVFAAGLQTVVYFEVRGSASSAAADAARDAAADGGNVGTAAAQAKKQIVDDVDDNDAAAITCTATVGTDRNTGFENVTVRCRGTIRLLLTDRSTPFTVDESTTVIRQQG